MTDMRTPRAGSAPTKLSLAAPTRPRLDGRVFVRGIAVLLVSQGFTWLSSAVITVTLPHYLGSANLGRYAFAVALFGLAQLAADLGIGTYLNRQVARDPASTPRLFTAALVSRFALGLAGAGGIYVGSHAATVEPVVQLTMDILCVNIVVDTLALAGIVLNSRLQIKGIAAAQAVSKLVVAGLVVLALRAGYGPPGVAMASLAGAVVSHAINCTVLLRNVRPSRTIDFGLCRELVVGGLPFFMMGAAVVIYSQIDTVMLARMTDPSVVGWYNAALRIISIPGFVPVITMAVVFPALSAAGASPKGAGIARNAIRAILVANVPIGVGMMLLPGGLTGLFHYPDDFSHSWPLITLLAAGMPLIGVDMVIGAVLVATDRQRSWTAVGVAAALLNPLVNLVAIPYTQTAFGNGAIGAAAVTSLTELFMMVMGLRLVPAGTFDRSVLMSTARVVLACVPVAAVAWLTREQPLFVPIVLGGVAYAIACLVTRAVTVADVRAIAGHLVNRRSQLEAAA